MKDEPPLKEIKFDPQSSTISIPKFMVEGSIHVPIEEVEPDSQVDDL